MIDLDPPAAKRIKTDHKEETNATHSRTDHRLSEADCGIKYFINRDKARFSCVLKALTSDFQVFEVDQSGKTIELTNVPNPIELESDRKQAKIEQQDKEDKIKSLSFDYTTTSAIELSTIIGQEDFDKVKELVAESQGWIGEGSNAPLPVLTKVIDDKATRTLVHKAIRDVFLGHIESEAKDDKRMKLSIKPPRSNPRQRGTQTWSRSGGWPHEGDYTHFTVYKDGRDTMDVVSNLSRALKVPAKSFSFAGTKDRRGCTTQRFSAHRVAIPRLAGLNPQLKGIRLGDFEYAKNQFRLGDLSGNKFALALRNIQAVTDEEIDSLLRTIKETGFVNYFGLQRFGTSATGTHEVGIHALRGDFDKACDLILSEHSGAWTETKDAKLYWIETHDAAATLEKMPNKCIAEQAILKHMVKNGQKGDWSGAFGVIPRNLRLMYIHAYQSLVWNNVVSSRLEKYGLKPVLGDLVIEQIDREDITRAKVLTVENLGQYTIHDVVLPLPGCDVLYPDNVIKNDYVDFMKQHGLDPFNMTRKTKEMSLLGSYRKILAKSTNLEWQMIQHGNKEEQLLATTIDNLEGVKISPTSGSLRALRLSFQLSTASYATMLLREVLDAVPHSV